MTEERDPSTAAEMRARAEQAEAHAEEAEALAAAARARAHAIQLRQQAELLEASEYPEAQADVSAEDEPASTPTRDRAGDTITGADTEATTEELTRCRRRTRLAVSASLAAIVILALPASLYLVWKHREASQKSQHAAEFAAAARQGVVTLTSLDFNHAKEDLQRIIDDSTGTFKDDIQKTTDDFIKVVEQSKVVEHGTVAATAVDSTSMTNDSAAVLVVSTSDITNAAGAKQESRRFRLIVTMNRDGDQLKMSKVEFLP